MSRGWWSGGRSRRLDHLATCRRRLPGFIADPSSCWQIVYSVAAPSDPLPRVADMEGPVVLAEG